jgi:hypothetical protein
LTKLLYLRIVIKAQIQLLKTKYHVMKKGELVKIKATNQEAVIVFVSTILEDNFCLLTVDGLAVRDSQGGIKEFFAEDLDYTDEQKQAMYHESELHSQEMQSIHPPLEYL